MKLLITYKSKTGFTKRYTEMIAEETRCEVLAFDEVTVEKMSEFDIVFFGGGIIRRRGKRFGKGKKHV
ncbi:MAG: hypothetical protein IJX63_02165 [Lachnospiraceae bacterium]|nr:hypothetical protein [Lachnospiraceae bacterium]